MGVGDAMQVHLRNPHGPGKDVWMPVHELLTSTQFLYLLGAPSPLGLLSCGAMARTRGKSGEGYAVHCVFDDSTEDTVPSIAAYQASGEWIRLDSPKDRTWDCQSCRYRTF